MLISVVLPAPFGPNKPKNSPSRTSRSMPASACTVPNLFRSSRIETATVIGARAVRISARSLADQFVDSVEPRQGDDVRRDIDAADLALPARGVALPLEDQRQCGRIRFGHSGEVDSRVTLL